MPTEKFLNSHNVHITVLLNCPLFTDLPQQMPETGKCL